MTSFTLWQEGLFECGCVFVKNVGFTLPQATEKLFQAASALGIPIKGHTEQLSYWRQRLGGEIPRLVCRPCGVFG